MTFRLALSIPVRWDHAWATQYHPRFLTREEGGLRRADGMRSGFAAPRGEQRAYPAIQKNTMRRAPKPPDSQARKLTFGFWTEATARLRSYRCNCLNIGMSAFEQVAIGPIIGGHYHFGKPSAHIASIRDDENYAIHVSRTSVTESLVKNPVILIFHAIGDFECNRLITTVMACECARRLC
jgi:hypothetical protein